MSHFTLFSRRLPLLATLWWGLSLAAFGQSGQNYLKTTVITVPGKQTEADVTNTPAANKRISYQYMDGLGRTVQQVSVQASPGSSAITLGYDLVQPVEYDHLGRQTRQYLPYVATTRNGSRQSNALTDQAAFYNNPSGNNADKIVNDAYPFALTVFDASPLGRVTEQGAPGQAWQPGT
jgi:hypothetical protein